MKIAFDVGITSHPATGISRYIDQLKDGLVRLGADLRPFQVSLRGGTPEGVARWRIPGRVSRFLWHHLNAPPIERLVGDVDVVHGTNFVLPARRKAAGIVTVHDVAFANAEGFPAVPRSAEWTASSIARSDGVIVPSTAVAREVVTLYRLPAERCFVIPEGVARAFFDAAILDDDRLAGLGIRKPFALALGTVQPRKNLTRLVLAWQRAASDLPDWTLVLAGPQGWGPEPPTAPRVVRTGWLDEGVLTGLVAAAEIFCFPSLYEGFGLPPLEAMAAGTPVLAGDYSAAVEVLGAAAHVVDRHDVDALAEGLRTLARDEGMRTRYRNAGRERAEAFTWERTAEMTLDAYRAVVSR